MLRPQGIRKIVLVTHGYHMPRAVRDFEAAANGEIQIVAAPMGLARGTETGALTWMPSAKGTDQVHAALREILGRLAGV